jgi:hypothetical protein
VAALKIVRNIGIAADLCQIVGRLHLDGKAVLTQVVGVGLATSALRVLVERHLFGCGGHSTQAHRKDSDSACRAKAFKSKYLFHRFIPFRDH